MRVEVEGFMTLGERTNQERAKLDGNRLQLHYGPRVGLATALSLSHGDILFGSYLDRQMGFVG